MNTASKSVSRAQKFDFMAGSERMLKVHHKNAVFLKSLESKKLYFDNECHRSLSKIQQEIYDIYFNEYLPLKEQSVTIKNAPKLPVMKLPKREMRKTIYRPGNTTRLPRLNLNPKMSKRENNLSSFENLLQIKEGASRRQLHLLSAAPASGSRPLRRTSNTLPLWSGFITDDSDSQEIDEKRMNIIKTAISLSSQPAKTPERKKKRLRKSFLVNLRRQSKVVWEKEILRRIGQTVAQSDHSIDVDDGSEESSVDGKPSPSDPVLQWRPSLSRNKIMNEDESGTDEEEEDFHFVDRQFAGTSPTSLVSSGRRRMSVRRRSTLNDAPVDDLEDMYYSESSPDIFSDISEQTGSSYTDNSFTSDREEDEEEEDVTGSSFSSLYSDLEV